MGLPREASHVALFVGPSKNPNQKTLSDSKGTTYYWFLVGNKGI